MTMAASDPKSRELIQTVSQISNGLMGEVAKVIIGKQENLRRVAIGILSNANMLIEDYPGLAKTLMANTFATSLGCKFKRVQFTPDLLPSDSMGSYMYDQQAGEFKLRPGPLFTNVLLADEINRAPPKTQAALLEAMEEKQVTIEGITHKSPAPFITMATQNPIEQEGTYPLPEAQMDRFMLKCVITYPEFDDEQQIIRSNINESFEKVKPVISIKDILKAQETVKEVYMDEKIEKYILNLIFATRYPEKYNLSDLKPLIGFGSSPRGSINLASAAKCHAFIQRRGYVIPEDIRAVIHDVLRHRIGLTYEAEAENVTAEDVISKIVNSVEVP